MCMSSLFSESAIAFAGVFVGVFLVQSVRALLSGRGLRTIVGGAIHLAVIVYVGTMFATTLIGSGASLGGFSRTMLDGLAGLERDMHQHIHKENHVLFPKALAMEAQLSGVRHGGAAHGGTGGCGCGH